MKKVFITLALLVAMTLSSFAQVSLFKPVPKDLFKILHEKRGSTLTESTTILWRFNATLAAEELIYNKTTKKFDSSPLSGTGPGFGIRHYYEQADGTAASDWGISLVALLGTDINNVTPASIKPALTVNAFNFLNVGVDTDFKTVGILLGVQVNF
jgi:hypothetical protein